jgi:hypothetical protein
LALQRDMVVALVGTAEVPQKADRFAAPPRTENACHEQASVPENIVPDAKE